MFSLFRNSEEDEMKQAQATFEKVTQLRSETRETRSARIRLGLLCRAHLDKTFVTAAEQTAIWQHLAAVAIANSKEKPPLPEPNVFQKIKSGDNEIFVYLPEEYVQEAFNLGSRYQRAEITPQQAIDGMQGLANQICLYELRLEEPFQVLQFLREELAQGAADDPGQSAAPASP